MTGTLIKVTPQDNSVTYDDFIKKMHEMGIFEKFNIAQIPSPVRYYRQEFMDHIVEHGLSSLYNFCLSIEDITSTSMQFDEVEKVAAKFIGKLNGARRLLIIDPYFFAQSKKIDVARLFSRLLAGISKNLEEICFITNGEKNDAKVSILGAIDKKIKIHQVITKEFHDRFWIDPDNLKGVLMGTSLNGLGNKIALIDKIKEEDVLELLKLAKKEGSPI
jgi:hypothetical protein